MIGFQKLTLDKTEREKISAIVRYSKASIFGSKVDIVYEKDLGQDTVKIVTTMDKYNPDPTWKKVGKEFLPAS